MIEWVLNQVGMMIRVRVCVGGVLAGVGVGGRSVGWPVCNVQSHLLFLSVACENPLRLYDRQ
jgi:hypothetical protein